jgi:hypothetical protein
MGSVPAPKKMRGSPELEGWSRQCRTDRGRARGRAGGEVRGSAPAAGGVVGGSADGGRQGSRAVLAEGGVALALERPFIYHLLDSDWSG